MPKLTLLYLPRVNSDPGWFKIDSSKVYCYKNLKTCQAVLLYVGYILAKTEVANVNNGHDTNPNKLVNLAG